MGSVRGVCSIRTPDRSSSAVRPFTSPPSRKTARRAEREQPGFAHATVNREVELLRRALRLGVESKRIVRMPVFPKKLAEKNARQGFFETGDFLKILAHLHEPLDDMARFAFATGWRGMLLEMCWSRVDRTGRVGKLPDSKNDDSQSVPLDDELLQVIERRWKAREYQTAAERSAFRSTSSIATVSRSRSLASIGSSPPPGTRPESLPSSFMTSVGRPRET